MEQQSSSDRVKAEPDRLASAFFRADSFELGKMSAMAWDDERPGLTLEGWSAVSSDPSVERAR